MGGFLANINVRSDDQQAVAAAFRRLPRREGALIAPSVYGWVTVFDQVSDEAADEDRLSGYTVMLSESLKTAAIGFLVYDSDVLLYTAADRGGIVDTYSSWPDYFDESLSGREMARLAGRPAVLAALTGSDAKAVERALRLECDFAEEALAALVSALGLPPHAARWGWTYLHDPGEPERPDGFGLFVEVKPAFGIVG